MTLKNLNVFLAVFRARSMTKASVTLNISQSAISQAIAALEKSLGKQLFLRSGGMLTPTTEGLILQTYAEQIQQLCQSAITDVQCTIPSEFQSIRLNYTVYDNAPFVIPNLPLRYHRLNPDIHLIVHSNRLEENERLLLSNDIDFALVEQPSQRSGIVSIPLYTDERIFICAENSDLLRLDDQDWLIGDKEQLSQLDIYIRDDGSKNSNWNFKQELHKVGIDPRIAGIFFSHEEVKRVVAADLGIGCVKRGTSSHMGGIKEFHVHNVALNQTLSLLYNRRKRLSVIECEFIDFIKQLLD